ncbi:MAG: acyl carrier protein [Bacteroidetes bacterium]|nr:acyl carrier protein [Bacteroidota bacterium]MCB9227659.1 acyl carrier protein [Chitinophagales bacterium]
MEALKQELKKRIIETLNLEDISIDEIKDDTPLFGEGLGLDSIDALELIVLLDRHYGIKITDSKEGRKIFESVQTMAEYVQKHRTK